MYRSKMKNRPACLAHKIGTFFLRFLFPGKIRQLLFLVRKEPMPLELKLALKKLFGVPAGDLQLRFQPERQK